MLTIDYDATDMAAQLTWEASDEFAPWLDTMRRVVFDHTEDATQDGPFTITLPWWNFAAIRAQLLELFRTYRLAPGDGLYVTDAAANLLRQSRRTADNYRAATTAPPVSLEAVTQGLANAGFHRVLSAEQLRNVAKIASLPAAATFSVPGAGKTTEALAYYVLSRQPGDSLLVVAPKNAFAAWDEQLALCLPHVTNRFVRLRGGRENIRRLLDDEPTYMLITYQQLVRVRRLVASHCARVRVHVFLDESHRIKSGITKVTARSALELAHLPIRKLIMSGTPMPQDVEDLIPQFSFLYPEIPSDASTVVGLIQPVYVRTTKTELNLPPITRSIASLQMSVAQSELYSLMRYEVARQAETALSIRNKQTLRALGRSVARLLQFVSNPTLLSSHLEFGHPGLLATVLAEGDGPKLDYVLTRARALARNGNKVLIWSSFVRNVEYIAERLADLGAVYIHGGVDAGDEDDDDTREGKIRRFHDDDNVRVLVANPAAASEGISLHAVCHHAIYLDRTFNAAHYLQSEDRIHRFGLSADQDTFIEIVECTHTIDETVRHRLNHKITMMAEALGDPSLRPDPIALDPPDIDDFEDYSTGLGEDDVQELLNDLREQD